MLKGIHQYSQSQCDWQWDGPDPNKIQLKKKTTTEWKCGGRGGDSPLMKHFLVMFRHVTGLLLSVDCGSVTGPELTVRDYYGDNITDQNSECVCECFCPPPPITAGHWLVSVSVDSAAVEENAGLWVRVGFFSVYILSFPLKQVSEPELNSPGCDLRP